jgi:hypothetical protein
MASNLGTMLERWRLRRLPLACPVSRFCVGFPAGHWVRWSCRMRFFGVPSAEAPRPQRLGAMLPVSGRKAYGVGADFSRQRPDPSGASRTMYEA